MPNAVYVNAPYVYVVYNPRPRWRFHHTNSAIFFFSHFFKKLRPLQLQENMFVNLASVSKRQNDTVGNGAQGAFIFKLFRK